MEGDDLSGLKDEIQTQQGFLREMKERYMPDSAEMSEKALEEYEIRNGELTKEYTEENFNSILQDLIKIETELYADYEKRVTTEAPCLFLDEHYQEDNEYPITQNLIDDIKEIYESDEEFNNTFKKLFPKIYPMASYISQSASQSRKSRAGKCLENHIENLLDEMGYEFSRQEKVDGAVIDIVIPSMEMFRENPDYTVFLACQTTLKDRFRLSLSKIKTDRIRTFIATGKNLITDNDENDLTKDKVKEIHDKGYRILVFDTVKQEQFPENNTVMSYSEFVQKELPNLAERWD